VCTNTTKQLGLHWSMLTLSQLSISSLCGAVRAVHADPEP